MLYLLRHGQSEANAAGLLVGRSDPPLTALGRLQAEAAGRALAGLVGGDVRILASPLDRAWRTAEIVAGVVAAELGEPVGVDVEERLIEMDYGSLDGLAIRDVDPDEWSAWRADASWRPPGGETLIELQDRVGAWCDETSRQASSATGDIVAVSHVSPIKASAIWALGGGPEMSWKLSLGVAALTRIALTPPSVVSFGETGHLSGLVAPNPVG